MLRIKQAQQRQPIGGHHMASNGVMFRGDSAEEVAAKIRNHRLINGIPLGNPEQEVIDYYGRKFPWMVENDTSDQAEEKQDPNYLKWRDSVAKAWGNVQPKMVGEVVASSRWSICETCPFNIPKNWEKTNEAKEFERKVMIMNKTANVPEKMQFCSLHGHDLGYLSFIESPSPVSRKTKDKPNYDGCWV